MIRYILSLLLIFASCQAAGKPLPYQRPVQLDPSIGVEASELGDDEFATPYLGSNKIKGKSPVPLSPPFIKGAKKPGGNAAYLIVIDAGHGGQDNGTQSNTTPVFYEKVFNLQTAIELEKALKKMGYRTLMTRKSDVFLSLTQRAAIANSKPSDLFVSVHFNAAPNKEASGIEVFYFRNIKDKVRTSESMRLAECVLKQSLRQTKAKSRGVKHGNLAVIRETTMPAILVEGGFMSNEAEMKRIKEPGYIKALSQGIASGIQDYLKGGCSKGK